MPKESRKKTGSARSRFHKLNRLHQLPVVFLAFVVVVLASIYLAAGNSSDELRFGDRQLWIEEVSSGSERQKGLSGREDIADDYGMLFVFEESDKHCFWMKDMNFPIDILWLDENKKVVQINAFVPPDSFPSSFCPSEDAKYVLEVKAGLSQQAGVDVGTQL